MKTLFLLCWLIIGLAVGNSLLLETACKFKPSQDVAAENKFSDELKTPTPTPSPAVPIEWKPSAYHGITPGKSTYKDVIKLFGKPEGDGNPEGDPEIENEKVILLMYGDEKIGSFDIVITDKTKIVYGITVYNHSRPTRQEIIAKYGTDYFEIESGEPNCVADDRKRGASDGKDPKRGVSLAYPEKGIVFSLNNKEEANITTYLSKCED